MDDNNVQNSLCITSMKQELSGPTEAHGPFIFVCWKYCKVPLHLQLLVLILYLKCGGGLGGGGVMFFSHFMLFPTFLEKKSGNIKQLFLI